MSALLNRLELHISDLMATGVSLAFLSGAQGAGKTFLTNKLALRFGDDLLVLGLDDFYKTKAERAVMAAHISPLFITRGPPGTHDVALLGAVIDRLGAASAADPVLLPVFDKVLDDRLPVDAWRHITRPPKLVLVEGWLCGVHGYKTAPLSSPLNAVEAEDQDATWRHHQEAALADYHALWAGHAHIHLRAPSFDVVLGWRMQQEAELLAGLGQALTPDDENRIARFIQHYERLTRRLLAGHCQAGLVLPIDSERRLIDDKG